MTQIRYKAFISYSHQDEAWGRWLQRSLESYRVPRRLVGSPGLFGAVSARVAPVFRDREDFSSASDLSASIRQELAASETLVVICSPAAAASPWVNEEIRYFRELGRGDRIFALIVDGDPQDEDPAKRCFPPALIEDEGGKVPEPLAADARKWADGRSLARLKLVSGIMGIRLDDLRRRDLQRKHRVWMVSTAGAFTVAILTTVLAVLAITAREQADNRREQAENLVGYMVSDLQDDLEKVGRLDILQGMGGEVSKYLETLDSAEVTDKSLVQQALVWRHLGDASMSQGNLDDAMKQFSASRDVLAELYRRHPQDVDAVYEMAQAEFWVGYVHLERGAFDEARQALGRYLDFADRLAELEPDNPQWLMEQSYAHGNIAALINRRQSEDIEHALSEIVASVEYNWKAIQVEPNNPEFISEYGEALAWQADTQMMMCDLGGAFTSRQENLRIAGESMQRDPANVNMRQRYAYSLSGLAHVARQVGLDEYAAANLSESARILGELFVMDPTNVNYRWEQLTRELYIALLQVESSGPGAALNRLGALYNPMLDVLNAEGQENQGRLEAWIDFLLHYAQAAFIAGEEARAQELLSQAIGQIADWSQVGQDIQAWRDEIVTARFLLWQYGKDGAPDETGANALPQLRLDGELTHISCTDRALLVLQAVLDGNRGQAKAHTEFLLSRGYFERGFVRICQQYDLCQGRG